MKKVSILLSALLFVACETVAFTDGRIPAGMLNEKKKLEGVYTGRFNGQSALLKLTFEGDRPVLSYVDARGSDLIDPKCASKIGWIKNATVSNNKLQTANFSFDTGQCKVDGRDLQLFIYSDNKMGVRLLDYEYLDKECSIEVPPPPASPVQRCHTVIRQRYFEGSFVR